MWKLCVDNRGRAKSARLIRSTGYPALDRRVRRSLTRMRFRPFKVNGAAVEVCTAVTQIYAPDST